MAKLIPKDFIKSIPGQIRKSNGDYTDVLTELGFTGSPVTPINSGYHEIGESTIRKNGSDYELADVLNEIGDAVTANKALTTRGDLPYRGASAVQRLAKGTSGQVLTQGADDPAWATPSAAAANVSLADSGALYAAENVEAALAEIGSLPVTAIPASGTIADGTKYRNSGPDANEPIGWVCTTAGTQGTLNSGSTTGSITTAKAALIPSALTGLAVGNYVNIVGVTGPLAISSIPAALGSTTVLAESATGQKYLKVTATTNFAAGETVAVDHGESHSAVYVIDEVSNVDTTVDVESAAAQKVLSVASTTGFKAGDPILIDAGEAGEEWKIIDTIQSGVSLTTTVNLAGTHAIGVTVETSHLKMTENLGATHDALETVKNCVVLGSAADATVTDAAVSYANAVISPYGYVNTDWAAWTPVTTFGTADPGTMTKVARYRIIDKTVFFNVYISSDDGNDASSLTISLPVAPKDNNAFVGVHGIQLVGASFNMMAGYIDDGTSNLAFYNFQSATNAAALKIIVTGFYEIA